MTGLGEEVYTDRSAALDALTAESRLAKLAPVVEAARKCLPVMRATGWHVAASCDNGNDIDRQIEAAAATECYDQLAQALATLEAAHD